MERTPPPQDIDGATADAISALGNYLAVSGDQDPKIEQIVLRLNRERWERQGDPLEVGPDAEPDSVQTARRVLRKLREEGPPPPSPLERLDESSRRLWACLAVVFAVVVLLSAESLAYDLALPVLITLVLAVVGVVVALNGVRLHRRRG